MIDPGLDGPGAGRPGGVAVLLTYLRLDPAQHADQAAPAGR